MVARPLAIRGGEPGAKAADEPAARIMPPQTIEEQAKAKAAEDAKAKAAEDAKLKAACMTSSSSNFQGMAKGASAMDGGERGRQRGVQWTARLAPAWSEGQDARSGRRASPSR